MVSCWQEHIHAPWEPKGAWQCGITQREVPRYCREVTNFTASSPTMGLPSHRSGGACVLLFRHLYCAATKDRASRHFVPTQVSLPHGDPWFSWAGLESQASNAVARQLGIDAQCATNRKEGSYPLLSQGSLLTKVHIIMGISREIGPPAGTASRLRGVVDLGENKHACQSRRAELWAIKNRQRRLQVTAIHPSTLHSIQLMTRSSSLRRDSI